MKWKVKVMGMNLVIKGLSPPKREKGITLFFLLGTPIYVQSEEIACTRTCVCRHKYVTVDVNM